MIKDGKDKQKIKQVIEGHIGKGKTVADLYPSEINAEIVDMVNEDLQKL